MNQQYERDGYFLVKNLFSVFEIQALAELALEFHESWKLKNSKFYLEQAINSAYLTGVEHLSESRRNLLFQFIGSSKLMKVVADVMSGRPSFMNTQLFFNPVNAIQKNYWHRDAQYHLSIDEQKETLFGPEVIHFRIPLAEEPGIELVPGTHRRWDTDEEFDIRLERNGHKNHENISTGVHIKLEAGDLLAFSANMIHRGLYGMNRLSLDIIFCDSEPSLMNFVSDECLPDQATLKNIEDPSVFLNTLTLKAKR